MRRMVALMIASAALFSTPFARADVLVMPEAPAATTIAKPEKGCSMRAVELAFGAPAVKHRAVGGGNRRQPPITRWDYPAFSVFFENGHVVDSVVPGSPPPVQHADELKS